MGSISSEIIYEGSLRTRMTHLHSGTEVITDAPLDNQGRAEAFSPTDLVAAALGSCMMTIMGIKARDMQLDLEGTRITIVKVMYSEPRRIGEIHVDLYFPPNSFSDKEKQILENAGRTCPVAKSLDPALLQKIEFHW